MGVLCFGVWMGLYKQSIANGERDCILKCRYTDDAQRWGTFVIQEEGNRQGYHFYR